MSVPSDLEWRRRWGELQTRRLAAAVSLPAAALMAWLFGGLTGWLFGFALPAIAFGALYAWRCPEGQHRFTGAGLSPMPSECRNCGVAAFDLPPEVGNASGVRRRWSRASLSVRLLRVIAVSQVVGGGLVGLITLTSTWQGVGLAWWYALMLEGIAFTAVLSGVLLWHGHPEGLRLTRILLALQIVKLYTPWITYDLRAGFGVLLHANASTFGVMLDARGLLQLGYGSPVQPSAAINVLAVAWLCALLGTRQPQPSPRSDEVLAPSAAHTE